MLLTILISFQLAVHLAEHLKSLILLDAAEFNKTMAHMQQLLPFDIRAHKTDQSIQIKIEEIIPVDNRMSLQNLVHGLRDPFHVLSAAKSTIGLNDSSDGPQKLTDKEYDSDTTEELPYTPAELEDDTFLPTYPGRLELGMFDAIEWTSWMNDDILHVLHGEP